MFFVLSCIFIFFFFNDTATTEIYTLSLHDALPIRTTRTASYTAHAWRWAPGEATVQVPAYVEYEKATSLNHALTLLARFGPEARVLAGGHSLIPMMKLRLVQPETLVDINGLTDLAYVTVAGGELRIGAMTRHAQLLESEAAGRYFAILHDA